MALVRWNRPELTVVREVSNHRRNLDRITWHDVLDAVGKVEMKLRRLHAEKVLSASGDLTGSVRVCFVRGDRTLVLDSVDADPNVRSIADEVSAIILSADFKASPTPMQIQLTCTFSSDRAVGGWNPGGDDGDDLFGGVREDRDFGDPF